MAVSTVDGWLASAKQCSPFSKASITTVAAAQYSLWLSAGVPAAGAAPGAAAVPTIATAGCQPLTNPTGGALSYLGKLDAMCAQSGQLILYDRLSHMSGLSGTVTTAQTVSTEAINRGDTTGFQVEGFLEWYTATGSTVANATVAWTDDTNTSRSSVIALAATRPASFMAPIPLISSANGVKSVQSVTLSASTLTAGNFGVTLCRRLATIPVIANVPVSLDPFALGLSPIDNNACMFFAFVANTTSSGVLSGALTIGQG